MRCEGASTLAEAPALRVSAALRLPACTTGVLELLPLRVAACIVEAPLDTSESPAPVVEMSPIARA